MHPPLAEPATMVMTSPAPHLNLNSKPEGDNAILVDLTPEVEDREDQ